MIVTERHRFRMLRRMIAKFHSGSEPVTGSNQTASFVR
jgi:hypothetical protein